MQRSLEALHRLRSMVAGSRSRSVGTAANGCRPATMRRPPPPERDQPDRAQKHAEPAWLGPNHAVQLPTVRRTSFSSDLDQANSVAQIPKPRKMISQPGCRSQAAQRPACEDDAA